jgi:hypothetical protein
MNLVILLNYRAGSDRRGNVFAGNDDADDDDVAPAKRTQFPPAAGFRFLRS